MSLERKSHTRRNSRNNSLRTGRRSSRLLWLPFILATMAFAVVACSHLPVYSHYEHIDSEGWQREDTITFTTAVANTADYQMMLGLRTTNAYPYTSLTFVARCLTANNGIILNDTITLNITDDDGNSNGRGIMIFQHSHTLPTHALHAGDTLTVSVSHLMSRHLLPGVTDVGLTVSAN